MTTKIITIATHKGGVGKTTSAVSLAHGLALLGKQTLLVDADPQAHAGTFLACSPAPDMFYLLMSGLVALPSGNDLISVRQRVRQSGRANLWVLPGSKETAMAQTTVVALLKPIDYLADLLKLFTCAENGRASSLDVVIVDTGPSLGGWLQEAAVWAANLVIAPVTPDFPSADGLRQFVDTLRALHAKGWTGKLAGVLPTMIDDRTRETRTIMGEIEQTFGSLVLPGIHDATVFRECAAEGETIFEMAPMSRAAREYQTVVDTVARML